MLSEADLLSTAYFSRVSRRLVNGNHFEAPTRNHKPELRSSPSFIFEAQSGPENQICGVSEDMRNCGVLVA